MTNQQGAPEALRFTKKPVTIEAIQWTGKNLREVITFTDGPPDTRSTHAGMAWEAYADLVARDGLKIYTLEGKMLASPGDWIIRGVKGECYPCKPDIFEATYSPAALAAGQATAGETLGSDAIYELIHGFGHTTHEQSMEIALGIADLSPPSTTPQPAPAAVAEQWPVAHDEELLEQMYWEFDDQRRRTGEERLAFKGKMRSYASEFRRRSDGKMTFAQSVSDDMMNLADRLGSEYDDVDPRAWKHLLVYAPNESPAAVAGPSDSAIPGRLGYSALMRLADENGLGPNNVSGKLQARIELYGRAVERAAIRAQQQLAAASTTQPAPQQEAQEPCPTCAALARTVMLDQVSFDRKPDCYGIRQITDDDGVEEWEDIRTSPDVAREEANDMMATGRGELYEVVPLWTTPQPSTTAQAASSAVLKAIRKANMQLVRTGDDEFMLVTYKNAKAQCDGGKCGIGGYCDDCPTPQADSQPAPDEIINMAREQGLPETEIKGVFRVNVDDLGRMFAADRAARAPADSVLEDAARLAKITQAIRDYHFALDNREHGGVAMARAWNAICDVLNMDWVQGAESAARKQGGAT